MHVFLPLLLSTLGGAIGMTSDQVCQQHIMLDTSRLLGCTSTTRISLVERLSLGALGEGSGWGLSVRQSGEAASGNLEIMKFGLKWVHMARYGLILTQI